jgi:hypothetical protein
MEEIMDCIKTTCRCLQLSYQGHISDTNRKTEVQKADSTLLSDENISAVGLDSLKLLLLLLECDCPTALKIIH